MLEARHATGKAMTVIGNSHYLLFSQADVEASVYHNSRLVSTGALDVMTTQRDVIYTAKAETRVKIHKKDKASLGITVARLVEEGGPPTKVHSRPCTLCLTSRHTVQQ